MSEEADKYWKKDKSDLLELTKPAVSQKAFDAGSEHGYRRALEDFKKAIREKSEIAETTTHLKEMISINDIWITIEKLKGTRK